MAVTIVVSFLLIIPIEWVIWMLALPSGLLIGYYANQRSDRRAGPWGRILVNGLFAGLVTGLTAAALVLVIKGAVLLRRQRLSRPWPRRPDRLPGRRRLRLPALPRRPGVARTSSRPASRTPRRSPSFYWSEQFGSAGTVVVLTALGGLGGAGAVRRLPPEAGKRSPTPDPRPDRAHAGPEFETPRVTRGVRGVGGAQARCLFLGVAAFFLGAALAVAFGAALVAAGFLAAGVLVVLAVVALVAVFAAAGLASAVVALASAAAALAAAASARAVLLSAARALPAAVWAPFALPALPAAMRALAALAAAALPVVLTTRPPVGDVVATERGVDLEGQARLAAGGCVRVDGADLGGPIERAQRLGQGGHGVDRRIGGLGRSAQSLRDERLRGGSARLQDLVAALGLTDPLESGRRTSARPGAGRLGQVGNLD